MATGMYRRHVKKLNLLQRNISPLASSHTFNCVPLFKGICLRSGEGTSEDIVSSVFVGPVFMQKISDVYKQTFSLRSSVQCMTTSTQTYATTLPGVQRHSSQRSSSSAIEVDLLKTSATDFTLYPILPGTLPSYICFIV